MDAAREWRYTAVSVRGSAHVRSGEPCQDAQQVRLLERSDGAVLLLVASDGAGSARYAETGARLCVETFVTELERLFCADLLPVVLDEQIARHLVQRVIDALHERATEAGATLRDYACTLLAAVVTDTQAYCWQRGDGAILREIAGQYVPVFAPDRGQYVNETGFITDPGAAEAVRFLHLEERLARLAVLTDGLEPVTIIANTGLGFERFFAPLLARLEQGAPGFQDEMAQNLAGLLDDERVNSKTGDDKTLLLAARSCK